MKTRVSWQWKSTGTIRPECLDWLIPLSEAHLRLILKTWVEHYNRGRPHSSLGPGVPDPPKILASVRPSQSRHRLGEGLAVRSKSVLGGLHHECGWRRPLLDRYSVINRFRIGTNYCGPQAFRAGFTASGRGGKQKPIFPFYQRLMEFQKRGRLDEHAALPNPARIQEQRGQPENQAIDGGQIRRPMTGTIADQQLMLDQQRFRGEGEGAGATWTRQLREGGK